MHCLAANSRLSQKSWYAPSMFDVSGGGNLSTDSSVKRQKRFQLSLRKFQRFTGSLWAGALSFCGVTREGRCCDRGNFARTRLSGSRLSWPKLAKARCCRRSIGERSWRFPLGYTKVQGCYMLPGIQPLTVRRCFVVTPVDMLAVEVANIQTVLL